MDCCYRNELVPQGLQLCIQVWVTECLLAYQTIAT